MTTATFDQTDPEPLFCYRHPDRETYVRCGRCDQPICTSCAMQGPVGMRCKQCGKPVRDALASLTPQQTFTAVGFASGAGALVGFFAMQFGWFMILLGFFAGGFLVEALDRSIGMKRGRRMVAIVVAGILLGALVGGSVGLWSTWRDLAEFAEESGFTFVDLVLESLPSLAIAAGATIAGAYGRMRL